MPTLTQKFEAMRNARLAFDAALREHDEPNLMRLASEHGARRAEMWLACIEADAREAECARTHVALTTPAAHCDECKCAIAHAFEVYDDEGETLCADCFTARCDAEGAAYELDDLCPERYPHPADVVAS